MNYIVYLLNNTITAIAPDTLDAQAEGYVYDDTDDYTPGLAIGDRRTGSGQYERAVPVAVTLVTEITPADFMRRFTLAEWCAANELRKTDNVMAYFFEMLCLVPVVHLDAADTSAGVAYMEHVAGILTAERSSAILSTSAGP